MSLNYFKIIFSFLDQVTLINKQVFRRYRQRWAVLTELEMCSLNFNFKFQKFLILLDVMPI